MPLMLRPLMLIPPISLLTILLVIPPATLAILLAVLLTILLMIPPIALSIPLAVLLTILLMIPPTTLAILLAVLLAILLTIPPSLLHVFLLSLWLLSSLSMLALLVYPIHNILAAVHEVQAEHPRMLAQNLCNIICRALKVTLGCITPAYHQEHLMLIEPEGSNTMKILSGLLAIIQEYPQAIGVPQVPTIDHLGFEMITE
ncbi:hypothetical protein BS47DRAFT_1397686 [Hydnum rufescens UP504]|uniref:Uncharacterized protein n=1 Tax=Hydnum rufescens UP504 TaxID=1448309 RepID=A0A9P6ANB9_9AGAM|nr:hypothetical protein BS47DRAFT_1397686 [Hydnum rufescens UP504]